MKYIVSEIWIRPYEWSKYEGRLRDYLKRGNALIVSNSKLNTVRLQCKRTNYGCNADCRYSAYCLVVFGDTVPDKVNNKMILKKFAKLKGIDKEKSI